MNVDKTRRWKQSVFALAVLLGTMSSFASADPNVIDDLSIEELMRVEIVTASNASEALEDAPATVIVISREEILDRGYTDLSEILTDLPGMEIIRPYGATYFKNYWRGYRNTIGDPFLVMIDGLVFNHLYFNTADVISTFPISNVARVEVVYGPASALYGPNAFMGVINIITLRPDTDVNELRGVIAAGSFDQRLVDLSYNHKQGDFSLTLTGRIDTGELDPSIAGKTEYTSNRYYGDRRLWGGFIDNPNLGGQFKSERDNAAIDIRAHLGNLEAGLQYFRLTSGYGTEYAADRAQNNAVWSRPDLSAYLRHKQSVRSGVNMTTTLRYRESGVSNDSFFVENASSSGQAPLADFSYWQSLNDSVSFFEDVEIDLGKGRLLTTGVKWERKNLQKNYAATYGPSLPPDEIDVVTYPYPDPPIDTSLANNSISTEDVGAYAQLRWELTPAHRINLGFRVDDNSRYDPATTIRVGYVGTFGNWKVKALYGEAFQEPSNRLLYGGWDGSGSDPTLEPERSRTTELSLGYRAKRFSTLASLYHVENEDTFINVEGGAMNLGNREVSGADLHGRAKLAAWNNTSIDAWAYYSHLFGAREDKHVENGSLEGRGDIGDLADDKLWVGATAKIGARTSASVRARWISGRPTVKTNPVGEIGSFTVVDATVRLMKVFDTPLGLTIAATNLFDENYAHPGVRDASAGTTPGAFDVEGRWSGSTGFFSSVLPQPGRSWTILMSFEP